MPLSMNNNEQDKKVQLKRRNFIFDGANSNDNLLTFIRYNGKMQACNQNRQNFAKKMILQNPLYSSQFPKNLLRELLILDIKKRKQFHQDSTTLIGIKLESQVIIKIGYDYLLSKLFKWNPLTINEFNDLMDRKYTTSDTKYYNSASRHDGRDVLCCSYTDRETVDDVQNLLLNLKKHQYQLVKSNVTYYKILMSNKKNSMLKIVGQLNYDTNLKEKLIQAKELALKFNENFQLEQIEIYNLASCNFDIIRGSMQSNQFDIRIQTKTCETISPESYSQFYLLQNFFKDVVSSRNPQNLLVKIDKDDIKLIKKNTTNVYQNLTMKSTFQIKLNNFTEYKLSRSVGNDTLFTEAAKFQNHLRMKSNLDSIFNFLPDTLNGSEIKSESYDEFIDELWKNSIWLSDISSSKKKEF